jgi:hypothetical protein
MNRTALVWLGAAAVVISTSGCAAREAAGRASTTGAHASDADHVCPMAVPGTTARAVDVVGGVALELTTDGTEADIAELRRRIATMAKRRSMGRMAGPAGGRGRGGAIHTAPPAPESEVRLEEIARGERVILLARDPVRIDELRARARSHAASMSGGNCPQHGGRSASSPNAGEPTPEGES